MRLRNSLITGASFALALTISGFASASSHREAPSISMDPAADNTDVWAWVSPGAHDKLYVVAAYNPLEEPSGGPNFHKFSDDVLYEVHITRGDKSLDDVMTYQIRFHTADIANVDPADLTKGPGGGKEFFAQLAGSFAQTYTLTKVVGGKATVVAKDVPVAPPNIGPRTMAVGKSFGLFSSATYDDAYAGTFIKDNGAEGRVWAGPRDDGFYVDLARIFDLANFAGNATTPLTNSTDGVSGFNCHAIALEIPTTLLTADGKPPTAGASDAQTLGVWASASRRKVRVTRHDANDDDDFGPWIQVSRLGLPLVNEALIGVQDKDKYNRTKPANDVKNFGAYFLNPVIVRDAEAVGVYAALGADPTPFKTNRLDIIDTINLTNIPSTGAHAIPLSATGDVLRVDLGVDSGFPNGRPLVGGAQPNQEQADVTDVLLSVILTKGAVAVSDGVNHNDKNYLTSFPYLALPWEGARQGHGKPAP